MRICLISPGHLSTNPRLVKEARALRSAGHTVHVICGRFQPWGTANDTPLTAGLDSVTYVAFGPTEASPSTYLFQNLVCRGARVLVRLGLKTLTLIEAAHAPIVRDLKAAARGVRADLYIAHYMAALPAAARAAAHFGKPYAFDAEDFHLGDSPETHAFEKGIIRAIESRYLPCAMYVTAASPLIAEAYAETYRIPPPAVILNVFPKANAPVAPTNSGTARPGPSIYWFSQTVGAGRGLETAIKAISNSRSKPHLYLRGSPATGYQNHLHNMATRLGIEDRLHFLDPAPPDELERLGAEFDVGYSGETGFSPNNLRALSNKLFSYLLSGLPTLASDTPALRGIAPALGDAITLFPIEDAAALAAAIDKFLLDPNFLAAARRHAWNLGQTKFNWDCEKENLLKVARTGTC
jgi:glycosyltransferase involved in cell wall biosynthesis